MQLLRQSQCFGRRAPSCNHGLCRHAGFGEQLRSSRGAADVLLIDSPGDFYNNIDIHIIRSTPPLTHDIGKSNILGLGFRKPPSRNRLIKESRQLFARKHLHSANQALEIQWGAPIKAHFQ